MNSRWFNIAVFLAWLATMTWLVTEKVLPPLLLGDPPNYSKIIEAQNSEPPVGWNILGEGKALGWALTDAKIQPTGITEIHGRVHFNSLPLTKLMSGWLQPLAHLLGKNTDDLALDARSLLVIDPFGRLERFDSAVQFGSSSELISVHGTVEGHRVQLLVRAADVALPPYTAPLPSNALLSDILTPQTHLPGLRLGQTWTVPVYSPLPTKTPLEIIRATVEGSEPIYWNGKMEDAWLVVYRSESGSPAGAAQSPKGRLWVRHDGMVLQQQAVFFDCTISFVRMGDKEAQACVRRAGKLWWTLADDKSLPGRRGP